MLAIDISVPGRLFVCWPNVSCVASYILHKLMKIEYKKSSMKTKFNSLERTNNIDLLKSCHQIT